MKIPYKEIQKIKANCPNNCTFHLNKASLVRKCHFCGKLYAQTHHRQVYCCKECSQKALQDQKNEWKRTKWVKPKENGTGYITEKRKTDFDDELRQIRGELLRLGIKQRKR